LSTTSTTLSFNPARISSALLVLAGVLWGTGGLAGVILQDTAHIGAVPVAAYRLLVGGVFAVAVTAATGGLRYLRGRATLGRLAVTALLLAQFQAAYQVAVAQISVSLATLITIGCVPVFVAGVTAVRERRLPDTRTCTAVAGAVGGLALLCGASMPDFGTSLTAVSGVAMSVAAGAGFAALTLITRGPLAGRGAVTSVGLLLGGVLLLPAALHQGMAVPLTGEVLFTVAYLGLVPTAIAYGAYFVGLRHAHPTAAALATMLEPLTATLLAVGWYGEELTAAGVLGAALIAGALALHYLRPAS
jgi:DME family drug/metabolite transporter